jgi:hypothetical protein
MAAANTFATSSNSMMRNIYITYPYDLESTGRHNESKHITPQLKLSCSSILLLYK